MSEFSLTSFALSVMLIPGKRAKRACRYCALFGRGYMQQTCEIAVERVIATAILERGTGGLRV